MKVFQLIEFILGYALVCSILMFAAMALFVALPLWWFIEKYFPDEPENIPNKPD
ncbi:hypothetical protein [Leptospira alexanderi]|uniref:hypothetical protein n=1 Tax=Leptospira alexanderi TaxID=100053 RepID=UPI00147D983C|nr:hypothetical protein [Leptospira alexanderi]